MGRVPWSSAHLHSPSARALNLYTFSVFTAEAKHQPLLRQIQAAFLVSYLDFTEFLCIYLQSQHLCFYLLFKEICIMWCNVLMLHSGFA